jgi:hypothetical protein
MTNEINYKPPFFSVISTGSCPSLPFFQQKCNPFAFKNRNKLISGQLDLLQTPGLDESLMLQAAVHNPSKMFKQTVTEIEKPLTLVKSKTGAHEIQIPQPWCQCQKAFALYPLLLKRKLAPHFDSSLHSVMHIFFNKYQHYFNWLQILQVLLTVSKNLIPYSSASAWPFDVGTAYKKNKGYQSYSDFTLI